MNPLIILVIAIILSYLMMPLVGDFYSTYISSIDGSWIGPDPERFTGFILSFLFWSSFLTWFFVRNNKKKIWLWFVLPPLFFLIGAPEELIVGVGSVISGWLLAQGILFIYNRFKNSEKPANP